jgi:hypothetical protein
MRSNRCSLREEPLVLIESLDLDAVCGGMKADRVQQGSPAALTAGG